MRRCLLPLPLMLAVLSPHAAHADRTYKIYKSNEFGRGGPLDQPEAVIQVDEISGEAKVYEPNIFGEADILEGPKYIIESDSLFIGHPHPSALQGLQNDNHEHHGIHNHDHDEVECEED